MTFMHAHPCSQELRRELCEWYFQPLKPIRSTNVSLKFPRFAVQVTFDERVLVPKLRKNKLRNPFLRNRFGIIVVHDRYKYNKNISRYVHTLINTCCMSSCVTTCDTLIELCTANPENSDIWPVIWLLTRCGN